MNLTNSKVSWRLIQSFVGFCLDHLVVTMLFGVAFCIFKSQWLSHDKALGIITYMKVYFHICSRVARKEFISQIVHSSIKTEELVTLN